MVQRAVCKRVGHARYPGASAGNLPSRVTAELVPLRFPRAGGAHAPTTQRTRPSRMRADLTFTAGLQPADPPTTNSARPRRTGRPDADQYRSSLTVPCSSRTASRRVTAAVIDECTGHDRFGARQGLASLCLGRGLALRTRRCSAASCSRSSRPGHCLGISLSGSMNGLRTVTPRCRPVGVSTSNSWPSGSASRAGSIA